MGGAPAGAVPQLPGLVQPVDPLQSTRDGRIRPHPGHRLPHGGAVDGRRPDRARCGRQRTAGPVRRRRGRGGHHVVRGYLSGSSAGPCVGEQLGPGHPRTRLSDRPSTGVRGDAAGAGRRAVGVTRARRLDVAGPGARGCERRATAGLAPPIPAGRVQPGHGLRRAAIAVRSRHPSCPLFDPSSHTDHPPGRHPRPHFGRTRPVPGRAHRRERSTRSCPATGTHSGPATSSPSWTRSRSS